MTPDFHDNTSVVRTIVLALRSLMTAADKLGRHAPQRVFSGYLEAIKTIELATPGIRIDGWPREAALM